MRSGKKTPGIPQIARTPIFHARKKLPFEGREKRCGINCREGCAGIVEKFRGGEKRLIRRQNFRRPSELLIRNHRIARN